MFPAFCSRHVDQKLKIISSGSFLRLDYRILTQVGDLIIFIRPSENATRKYSTLSAKCCCFDQPYSVKQTFFTMETG